MNPIKREKRFLYVWFLVLLLTPDFLSAQSEEDPFDELIREKKEIFGSEKEEKFPIRAIVYDREDWPGHSSWHAFWLIRKTDYPKFNQFRIFPFFNSISAKSGKASMNYLFPFYSYRFTERDGTEDVSFLSPLYYSRSIRRSPASGGLKEDTKFFWLAYNSSASGPGYENNFLMIPGFFPLFMRETETENGKKSSSMTILPALFFSKESAEESSTTFTLFQWGSDSEKRYFRVLPFLYYSDSKRRDGYSFAFFPLLYRSKSESNSVRSSSLYSPLWWESEESGSGSYSNWGFSPLLLYYWNKSISVTGESSRRFFLPLLLYAAEDGEHGRLRNFLIFHWGKEYTRSFFTVFPLYFSNYEQTEDRFRVGGPLYYYSGDREKRTFYAINTFAKYDRNSGLERLISAPFLFYKKDSYFTFLPFYHQSYLDDGDFLLLALPLIYRRSGAEYSRNLIFNAYWEREKGRTTALTFFPFWFEREGRYFHFAPFYFSWKGDGNSVHRAGPLYYQYRSEDLYRDYYFNTFVQRERGKGWTKFISAPFVFYEKDSYLHLPVFGIFHFRDGSAAETVAPFYYAYDSPEKKEFFLLGYHDYKDETRTFHRFHPFYYSSAKSDGSSFLGFGGLFYRWKDSAGDTSSRLMLPIHYYRKNEFNLWLPFYYRFGQGEDRYVSFSPIHYRQRSATTDRDWLLVYYSSENREEKTASRYVVPFYFEWKGKESSGDILLPFYLKYYERNKNLELYFGGFSVSQTAGAFDASFKSGESKKQFYVDLDYSFVYNIFSVSLRKEISNPLTFFQEDTNDGDVSAPIDGGNSGKNPIPSNARSAVISEESGKRDARENGFASYKKLARETSRNYFGWEFLFGIASYQSGDEKSHFRILPLGWFTWGKNDDDRVFAFPLPLPTFWGTSGNEAYRVVFPFYAEQRKGSDFIRSIGLFLFVQEKEKDREDYSFLWPLLKYSRSKDEVAYRFFPLFTHRESAESTTTKSIFYYRSKERTGTRETSAFHGILFPLYHSRGESYDKNGDSTNSGYTLFFPFYYTNYEDRSAGGIPTYRRRNVYSPLMLYRSSEDVSLREKKVIRISPLFYSSYREGREGDLLVSESGLFLTIPLLYTYDRVYSSANGIPAAEGNTIRETSGWDWIFLANYERSKFHPSNENRVDFKLLLGGIFGYSSKTSPKEERYSWNASLLYFRKRVFEAGALTYSSDSIPILYSNEETPDSSETTVLLLAGIKTNLSSGMKRTMFLPFWYGKEEVSKKGYTDSTIFTPLFIQSKSQQEGTDANYSAERIYPILPLPFLYTFESRTREDKIKKNVWGFDWLVFLNYKNTKYLNDGSESVSLKAALALFGYEKNVNSSERETGLYLFPFLFHKSSYRDGVDYYRTVIPVVMYRSYRERDGKVQSRTNLFGILMNYHRNDEAGTFSFFLFPSLYFSKEEATGDRTSAILPLFYYSRNTQNPEYSLFLIGFYKGRTSEYERSNFLHLFDLKNSIREQKTELSLFLGIFHSEFEKDRTRWAVLGGILAGYESSPVMTDWNFLWIRYLNSPQERVQNFLPIYRYSETADSSSFLAPPILTYHSTDKDGTLTLAGLGLLYYKNRSEIDREENTKILGGLAFFSESKAERGYRSMGSLGLPLLGGILWQYEYEEETGFEKFSLLKVLFSRTTHNGKTYNRVFGVKL
ncbi:hypothetical protein CH379_004090 [Leptospira ellisii]|uniref:Uncharacterized protein n=2 Tax=Leptospira ellisii TaxID=2023197 RepID=A0A2N0BB16_9LEPT|nr:hypothetical protein [Leptospira ellisii]MDV6234809.1 hypothetical protein [Leptospira ellisii]PJZ93717.1 hypothetical protein CH379_06300 [Leptospira ellisii]